MTFNKTGINAFCCSKLSSFLLVFGKIRSHLLPPPPPTQKHNWQHWTFCMKQCLEVGCWAGSVNVRNHDLPSFTTIYQCNSPESCHGGPDNKTFNCRISKTSQRGFKSIIFFRFAHIFAFLFRQNYLAFQCYLEGYHAISKGVSI